MKKKIVNLREKTGMSRKAFRAEFGIPERTLQSWEEGERTPPDYVLKLLEKSVSDYCSQHMLVPSDTNYMMQMTVGNLLSVVSLTNINDIAIAKDIDDGPLNLFHFWIPKYSGIIFSDEMKSLLLPMVVEKAKFIDDSLHLQLADNDLDRLFNLLEGISIQPTGIYIREKSESLIILYNLNEVIYNYEQAYPEATVFLLNKKFGIVVFNNGTFLKMYNADNQLLGTWSGKDRYREAEEAFAKTLIDLLEN